MQRDSIKGICRPLRNHSATWPKSLILALLELPAEERARVRERVQQRKTLDEFEHTTEKPN
jgi:hypothetical protein